jgi:hypothetical protein
MWYFLQVISGYRHLWESERSGMVTVKDVAARAGVSMITVSRVGCPSGHRGRHVPRHHVARFLRALPDPRRAAVIPDGANGHAEALRDREAPVDAVEDIVLMPEIHLPAGA